MRTRYRTIQLSGTAIEAAVDLVKNRIYEQESIFWVNIEPDVDKDNIHTGSIFWKAFSSRGPMIPKFTWVSASTSRGNYQPAQVGLAHPVGNAVLNRLEDFKIEIPEQWILQQDHPKRGLVIELPKDYDAKKIVEFALAAIPVVSPFEFDNQFILKYPIR